MTDPAVTPIVASYFDAAARSDHECYVALFDDDAVVEDEGGTYHGINEIRQWRSSTPLVSYEITSVEPIRITRSWLRAPSAVTSPAAPSPACVSSSKTSTTTQFECSASGPDSAVARGKRTSSLIVDLAVRGNCTIDAYSTGRRITGDSHGACLDW
jgi:hypothetical protein